MMKWMNLGPAENGNQLPVPKINPMVESELHRLSNILVDILQQSWGPNGVPILYVEEPNDLQVPTEGQELAGAAWKRSRYYRRYPWKRQNSRSRTWVYVSLVVCMSFRHILYIFKILLIHKFMYFHSIKLSIYFLSSR